MQSVAAGHNAATFSACVKNRSVIHAFAGHLGKHDRLLAAGMARACNVFRSFAGEQQAIIADGRDGFYQRAIHPESGVQCTRLTGSDAQNNCLVCIRRKRCALERDATRFVTR
jgi:hypothetical protein